MSPEASTSWNLTPDQLRPLLQEVADAMSRQFAPDPWTHEEAVFAAAALILPELEIRRATVRLEVIEDPSKGFVGRREATGFALLMQGQQFNLQGPASDGELVHLVRERLTQKILLSHPQVKCRTTTPPSLVWVNPGHMVLSPRLSTRLPFARAHLRALLMARQIEQETSPSHATRPGTRL